MEVIDIIKDAFEFPSKDMKILLVYIVLSLLAGAFSLGGALMYGLGFYKSELFLWGGLALIIAMVIAWIMYGYSISVIKSGIELDNTVPEFSWWDNFITGFDNFIVTIVYFLIPAFIVAVIGIITDIYGNMMTIIQGIYLNAFGSYVGASTIASDAIAQAMVNLIISLSITITVAIILFVIFSFLQTMAQARLANTGSLSEALNITEAAKDIMRIGVGKVIILVLLVIIVIGIVNIILSAIFSIIPILAFLSFIVTPYLTLFAQRAVGLLYSDIA